MFYHASTVVFVTASANQKQCLVRLYKQFSVMFNTCLALSSTYELQQQHLLPVLSVVNMNSIKRTKRRIEENGVDLAVMTVDILKVRNDLIITASLMPSTARLRLQLRLQYQPLAPLLESFLLSCSRYRKPSRIRSWR